MAMRRSLASLCIAMCSAFAPCVAVAIDAVREKRLLRGEVTDWLGVSLYNFTTV